MFDKDELLKRLHSMNPSDVAAIVKKAWDEANDGFVECSNCVYGQEDGCWEMQWHDGCWHGEPITNEEVKLYEKD